MTRKFYLDLLERSVWTFVQAFAAAWVVVEGADPSALFTVDSLELAAVAGVIAVVKALVATQIGDKDSASTLPEG